MHCLVGNLKLVAADLALSDEFSACLQSKPTLENSSLFNFASGANPA
jgi:hypothetical protein